MPWIPIYVRLVWGVTLPRSFICGCTPRLQPPQHVTLEPGRPRAALGRRAAFWFLLVAVAPPRRPSTDRSGRAARCGGLRLRPATSLSVVTRPTVSRRRHTPRLRAAGARTNPVAAPRWPSRLERFPSADSPLTYVPPRTGANSTTGATFRAADGEYVVERAAARQRPWVFDKRRRAASSSSFGGASQIAGRDAWWTRGVPWSCVGSARRSFRRPFLFPHLRPTTPSSIAAAPRRAEQAWPRRDPSGGQRAPSAFGRASATTQVGSTLASLLPRAPRASRARRVPVIPAEATRLQRVRGRPASTSATSHGRCLRRAADAELTGTESRSADARHHALRFNRARAVTDARVSPRPSPPLRSIRPSSRPAARWAASRPAKGNRAPRSRRGLERPPRSGCPLDSASALDRLLASGLPAGLRARPLVASPLNTSDPQPAHRRGAAGPAEGDRRRRSSCASRRAGVVGLPHQGGLDERPKRRLLFRQGPGSRTIPIPIFPPHGGSFHSGTRGRRNTSRTGKPGPSTACSTRPTRLRSWRAHEALRGTERDILDDACSGCRPTATPAVR